MPRFKSSLPRFNSHVPYTERIRFLCLASYNNSGNRSRIIRNNGICVSSRTFRHELFVIEYKFFSFKHNRKRSICSKKPQNPRFHIYEWLLILLYDMSKTYSSLKEVCFSLFICCNACLSGRFCIYLGSLYAPAVKRIIMQRNRICIMHE